MITEIKKEDLKKTFRHDEKGDQNYKLLMFDNGDRTALLKNLSDDSTYICSYDNLTICK